MPLIFPGFVDVGFISAFSTIYEAGLNFIYRTYFWNLSHGDHIFVQAGTGHGSRATSGIPVCEKAWTASRCVDSGRNKGGFVRGYKSSPSSLILRVRVLRPQPSSLAASWRRPPVIFSAVSIMMRSKRGTASSSK